MQGKHTLYSAWWWYYHHYYYCCRCGCSRSNFWSDWLEGARNEPLEIVVVRGSSATFGQVGIGIVSSGGCGLLLPEAGWTRTKVVIVTIPLSLPGIVQLALIRAWRGLGITPSTTTAIVGLTLKRRIKGIYVEYEYTPTHTWSISWGLFWARLKFGKALVTCIPLLKEIMIRQLRAFGKVNHTSQWMSKS